jgi:ribosomal protein S18 acetylase RimI-like enzyme
MKNLAPSLSVRSPSNTEQELALARLRDRWGSVVVTRAVVHRLAELPMLVAWRGDALIGCLTFRRAERAVELITLDAFVEHAGVGSALLRAAIRLAPRVWLVTTNDNLPAQALYRKHGGRLVAIHRGAVAQSRLLKPSIPTHGYNGDAIADELVFEWVPAGNGA